MRRSPSETIRCLTVDGTVRLFRASGIHRRDRAIGSAGLSYGNSISLRNDGPIFEWDKARRNPDKHGIAFVGALAVFEDPRRIERLDLRRDCGGERVQIIGRSKGRLSRGDRRRFHLRQVNRLLLIMEQAA